jgi:cytochrome c oxidase assembly protein subunit 15
MKPIPLWLFLSCFLVASMVWIGGVTRLTDSGLSIVRWEPIHGTIPPLNEPEWQEEFAHYQQSPEYQKVNKGMSLEEFKGIYFFEYTHRLLGRVTGLVFLLPFLYFLFTKQLDRKLSLSLFAIFLLGASQGLVGWLMVKSGLVNDPRVSPYRLALHLSVALIIYSLIFFNALTQYYKERRPSLAAICPKFALLTLTLIALQIISGAFVAGLDAGLVYNTYPMMGDRWIPQELGDHGIWYHDLFENPVTAQFVHRCLAVITATATLAFAFYSSKALPRLSLLLAGTILLQLTLGISTLLTHVPVSLASAHQMGAVLVLTVMLRVVWHPKGKLR